MHVGGGKRPIRSNWGPRAESSLHRGNHELSRTRSIFTQLGVVSIPSGAFRFTCSPMTRRKAQQKGARRDLRPPPGTFGKPPPDTFVGTGPSCACPVADQLPRVSCLRRIRPRRRTTSHRHTNGHRRTSDRRSDRPSDLPSDHCRHCCCRRTTSPRRRPPTSCRPPPRHRPRRGAGPCPRPCPVRPTPSRSRTPRRPRSRPATRVHPSRTSRPSVPRSESPASHRFLRAGGMPSRPFGQSRLEQLQSFRAGWRA